MRIHRRIAIAVLALASVIAASCGDDSDGSTASGGTQPQTQNTLAPSATTIPPKQGGQITFLVSSEGRGYDPTLINGSGPDGNQSMALFDVLIWLDPVTGKIQPQIAESVSSTDGKVWTIKLRSGVKFSDGTPFDAEAVKFNWERHGDPANRSAALSVIRGIQTMTVTDPLTLTVTLNTVNGQFPRILARRLNFIGSPTAIKALGAEFANKPVGAGPFKLTSWDKGNQMVVERNPTYWNAPRPYLDKITFKAVADNKQRYDTFNTGADLAWTNDPKAAVDAKKDGHNSVRIVMNGGANVAFNTTKAPFDDARIRKAVAHVIDVNALNASFGQGNEVPADTLFLDTNPFYDATAKKPAYDLAAAQKLIDAYVAEKGGPVRFKMGAFLVNRGAAEFIQAQFAGLKNVQMEVESGDTSALVQSVTVDRNFQAQIWGVNLVPDPESQLYEFLHSTSSGNFSGYKNPAMDAALDKGRTSLTDADRKAAYQQVQQILMTDVPTIFLYHTQLLLTAKSNLHDVTLWNEGALLADRIWKS